MSLRKILLSLLATGFFFAPEADAKDKYTIGLVAKSQGNPVFQAARVGAEQAAKDLGAKYKIQIEPRSVKKQIPISNCGGNLNRRIYFSQFLLPVRVAAPCELNYRPLLAPTR